MERKPLFGDLIASHEGLAEELKSVEDANLTLEIKRKSDGEVKFVPFKTVGEFSPYPFEEGNYSCDCNRKILFDNIGYQSDCPCGDYGYSLIIRDTEGRILYSD